MWGILAIGFFQYHSINTISREAANSIWWCLLDDVRTFFEQNPDAD
jgi:hypothetical protein